MPSLAPQAATASPRPFTAMTGGAQASNCTSNGEAGDHDARSRGALRRQLLLQHHGHEQEPAERGAGGLDHPAVGERHEQEAGIAEQGERQAAEQRKQEGSRPTHAAQIREAAAGDERQERQPGPDEAMKGDVRRRESSGNTVARGDEAGGPEQRRAGTAGDAE